MKGLFIVATERQHAVSLTKSLRERISSRYGACPMFCNGSIQDAFNAAFAPSLIKKVHFYCLILIHRIDDFHIMYLASTIAHLHPSRPQHVEVSLVRNSYRILT